MRRRKKKLKKIVKIILILVIVMLSVTTLIILKPFPKNTLTNKKTNSDTVNSHYSSNVITNKESKIYVLENNNYKEIGTINKDVILTLKEEDITNNTKYFTITNMDSEYYINYKDVDKTNKKEDNDDRYKKYIVFNENVVSDNLKLYDDEKLVYTINKHMSLPIIIKDVDKYYVEYANHLFYVKKEEVKIEDSNNTEQSNTNGIGVLNYHFFYDENDKEQAKECNQDICASKSQFKEHLDYIKDNNFLTLKVKELEMYIDGKIRLPKSVLITIDDGWLTEIAETMLAEYKMYGTIFVVTSWNDPKKYISEYVEVHSHSDNMHNQGDCPTGQGGGIQCLPEETILNDLKTSSDKIGGTNVFCYPFYEYNDYSISLLKKAGYTMAFAGETPGSDNLVKVGSNKFTLPRFVVVNYTTMNDFSRYLNGQG